MISQELLERIGLHQIWQKSGRGGVQLVGDHLDFSDAVLDSIELTEAIIPDSTFCGSSLRNADLAYCVLLGAKFTGCDMSGIGIPKGDMSEADLSQANLTGAKLNRTRFWQANMQNCILDRATLGGGSLTDADLRGASLIDCDIGRTRFERTKIAGANLRGLQSVNDAIVVSIDIGTVLEGEVAREWLRKAAG